MLGLIPFLVDDFVTGQIGPDARATAMLAAGFPANFAFDFTRDYDDAVCRNAIVALTVALRMPMPRLLDRLGVHFLEWFDTAMPGLFDDVSDTTEFLLRLPAFYNSIGATARGSTMPGSLELVSTRNLDGRLRVTYQSRNRFARLYVSFIRAVAARFGETASISVVAGDLEAPYCVLDVTMAASAAAAANALADAKV